MKPTNLSHQKQQDLLFFYYPFLTRVTMPLGSSKIMPLLLNEP